MSRQGSTRPFLRLLAAATLLLTACAGRDDASPSPAPASTSAAAAAGDPGPEPWSGTNLLSDPGFEEGGAGWFHLEDNPGWGGYSIVGEPVRTGARAARLQVRWDPAEPHLPSKVFGLIQEPEPEDFPEHLAGWYRVDAWQKEHPATKLYAQVVVIVIGDRRTPQIVSPDRPVASLDNYQVRFILTGAVEEPFSMRNGKFRFLGPAEPERERWVRFRIPLREEFQRAWGTVPRGFARLRVLFEARWDGRPPGTGAVADVAWDDLFLGTLEESGAR